MTSLNDFYSIPKEERAKDTIFPDVIFGMTQWYDEKLASWITVNHTDKTTEHFNHELGLWIKQDINGNIISAEPDDNV